MFKQTELILCPISTYLFFLKKIVYIFIYTGTCTRLVIYNVTVEKHLTRFSLMRNKGEIIVILLHIRHLENLLNFQIHEQLLCTTVCQIVKPYYRFKNYTHQSKKPTIQYIAYLLMMDSANKNNCLLSNWSLIQHRI